MNAPRSDAYTLRSALSALRELPGSFSGTAASVPYAELLRSSILGPRAGGLHGCSTLLATRDPLTASLALVELDGLARRIVLCPPGFQMQHLSLLLKTAEIDAIVSDSAEWDLSGYPVECILLDSQIRTPAPLRTTDRATEWVLLTSGTTGPPKLVVHSLVSLASALQNAVTASSNLVWSTFYDIRRYGGLQIYLRALLCGASLVLSNPEESTAAFLTRASEAGVTHISGTPSHWRRALMHAEARLLRPVYVRLSGEIADQPILDHLRHMYPDARIVHAFASTEAGLALEVVDELAGIPASVLQERADIAKDPVLKIESGTLRIRSGRTAERYLGAAAPPLKDADGFVDTCDLLVLQGDRYHFAGRVDGVINVGGLKVHPEEVEAVLNRCPGVHMSLVRSRKSAITGAIVIAEVVLKAGFTSTHPSPSGLEQELLRYCRQVLPTYKVPATIRVVASLDLSQSGKLSRSHA